MVQSKKHVMPLYCDSTFKHLQDSLHIDRYGFFQHRIHWKQVWFIWYDISSSSLSISELYLFKNWFFFWCKSLVSLTSNSIFTLCCFYHPWWQHWNRFLRDVGESTNSKAVWTQSRAAYCRLHCSVSGVGLKDLHRSIPTSTIQWYCGSPILSHSTSICSFSQGYWKYGGYVHLLGFGVLHGLKCKYLPRRGLLWAQRRLTTTDFPTGYMRIAALAPGASPTFLLHRPWDLQDCFPYFF